MLRASEEPAWILHRRPFRESSLILDLLTRRYGRVSVVSRGSRKARGGSSLQAFQPLKLDFYQRGELGTLGRFETTGAALALQGVALWSGFYANELILRLVSPGDTDDPQPIFDDYVRLLERLRRPSTSPATDAAIGGEAGALRQFEYRLLCYLGLAIDAAADALGHAISPQAHYRWDVSRGIVAGLPPTARSGADSPSLQVANGAALLALIHGSWNVEVEPCRALLQAMLQQQLGARPLQTAAMLRDLLALRRRAANFSATQNPPPGVNQ